MPEKRKPNAGRGAATSPPIDGDTLRRRIEERAYFRYCEGGRVPGAELEDWLAAEQEGLAELTRKAAGLVGSGTRSDGTRLPGW